MNKWDIELFRSQGGLRAIRDGAPDDLFLACAGYEERAVAVAQSLSPDYRAKVGIIYKNRELFEDYNCKNAEFSLHALADVLKHHCDAVAQVEGSWRDPKVQLISLRDSLVPKNVELAQEWAVTIDTTTFNREALLTALAILRMNLPRSIIRITYTSPVSHGDWLSRGFREIRNVMSFAGVQQSSRPTVLAVLSGFEPERTLKVIEEHEPSKVLLGIGDPPTKQQFLERNLNEQKLILSRQKVEEFRFPVDNIKACWRRLEDLLSPYLAEHNVVLSAMNTKLSTLAAFLTAERHPEIQITCCVPGEYNTENYSSGMDSIFIDYIPNDQA